MTAETEFKNFFRECGIDTNDAIIGDSKIRRFHVIGDKKGSKNGAYQLHCDGEVNGWVQSHKDGFIYRYKADSTQFAPPTPAEKAEFERKKHANHVEQVQKHESAAIVARKLWQQGAKVTNPNQHPYLLKKRITGNYARILAGDLIIAMYSENRDLSTLQFIDASGAKRFLSGGKKAGCFAVIGKHHAPHDRILVVEGYATGESLHDDTGNFVVCAMDSGNLEPVARVIRRLFPDAPIVICGDNDLNQVGQKAARAAALACGGCYLIPEQTGADWNDVLSGGME
jgi:putative DNA primase/helicase